MLVLWRQVVLWSAVRVEIYMDLMPGTTQAQACRRSLAHLRLHESADIVGGHA